MANNGETMKWIHWLVGIIWGALLLIITTIGTNVIANERGNVSEHAKTRDRVAIVEKYQEAMKTDISWIKEKMNAQSSDIKEMKAMVREMYRRG